MESEVKNTNKNEWLNTKDKRMVKVAAFIGSGLIVGSVLFFTGRHFYRVQQSKKTETKSLNDGSPENYAKRLKMAFDNNGFWGTDMDEVRKVFTEIPTQEDFVKVADKYAELTKQNKGAFFKDLTDELTTSEYYEMQSILKGKPLKKGIKAVFDLNFATSVSHRIKAAFDYTIIGMPSTDKGALEKALREIPTLYAFAMVKYAYKKEYGHEIETDLNSELDAFDFSWKAIIYTKPVK